MVSFEVPCAISGQCLGEYVDRDEGSDSTIFILVE